MCKLARDATLQGQMDMKWGVKPEEIPGKQMTSDPIPEARRLAREGILTGKEVLDELEVIAATKRKKRLTMRNPE